MIYQNGQYMSPLTSELTAQRDIFGQPVQANSFNNYGSQFQQQSTQQMQQNVQAPMMTNVEWIKIDDIKEVENISVGQNQERWFMFSGDTVFGKKTANGLGVTNVDYFRFEPYNINGTNQTTEVAIPEIDLSEYMKLGDMKGILDELDSLRTELNFLKELKNPKEKETAAPKTTQRKKVVNDVAK